MPSEISTARRDPVDAWRDAPSDREREHRDERALRERRCRAPPRRATRRSRSSCGAGAASSPARRSRCRSRSRRAVPSRARPAGRAAPQAQPSTIASAGSESAMLRRTARITKPLPLDQTFSLHAASSSRVRRRPVDRLEDVLQREHEHRRGVRRAAPRRARRRSRRGSRAPADPRAPPRRPTAPRRPRRPRGPSRARPTRRSRSARSGPARRAARASARPRSTTGTTAPRRSITPSISARRLGQRRACCQRTTSRTCATSSA